MKLYGVKANMKKLINIIFIFNILISYLYATNLMELRSILGEEETQERKEIIENTKPQILPVQQKKEVNKKSEITYNSLLDAPSNYYTINITTTNGINEAKKYLRNNNIEETDFYLYSFGPEMKNAKIIYGAFKSVDEANDALKKLPSTILENKPYIDNIKKHQKLFLKYN